LLVFRSKDSVAKTVGDCQKRSANFVKQPSALVRSSRFRSPSLPRPPHFQRQAGPLAPRSFQWPNQFLGVPPAHLSPAWQRRSGAARQTAVCGMKETKYSSPGSAHQDVPPGRGHTHRPCYPIRLEREAFKSRFVERLPEGIRAVRRKQATTSGIASRRISFIILSEDSGDALTAMPMVQGQKEKPETSRVRSGPLSSASGLLTWRRVSRRRLHQLSFAGDKQAGLSLHHFKLISGRKRCSRIGVFSKISENYAQELSDRYQKSSRVPLVARRARSGKWSWRRTTRRWTDGLNRPRPEGKRLLNPNQSPS